MQPRHKGGMMEGYRHILLAVDFAPESEAILPRAVDLAQRYDAKLSLIHVVEHAPLDPANELLLVQEANLEQQLLENARTRLAHIVQDLPLAVTGQWVELGSTKTEIVRVATEQNVDLIVVGSHGRHGLALLLGSTANAVLHAAPCDVLAVRVKR